MAASFILGIVLLIAGVFFRYACIRRNYFLGYRTFRSMKSDANWDFANRLMGKFSLMVGSLSMLAGALSWYFVFSPGCVIYLTLGLLLVSIAVVEVRLRQFEKASKGRS
jgi:uncharacterized membrane protein